MSYKTIVLVLNEVGRAKLLVDLAADIAERQEAHVTALYVIPSATVYPSIGMDLGPHIFEGFRVFFQSHAETVKAVFEERMRRSGLTTEWRCVDAASPVIADAAIEHGLQADLVIVSQVDPDSDTGVELDFVERVVMGAGRPVLVVPLGKAFESVGTRALVGWNGTRESARAAFDAVPLLKRCESVTITWVDPQKTFETPGVAPGAELASALSRHGVTCTAEGFPTSGLTAGEALGLRASDLGADLLVMGAYGHSRMRQFVFGGATRFMLEKMPVPVLLSH